MASQDQHFALTPQVSCDSGSEKERFRNDEERREGEKRRREKKERKDDTDVRHLRNRHPRPRYVGTFELEQTYQGPFCEVQTEEQIERRSQ